MSWFSELTGKAGAMLDKMDHVAAVSLQEAGIGSPSQNTKRREQETEKPSSPHGATTTSTELSGAQTPYEPTTHHQPWTTSSERGAAVAQVLVGSASGSSYLNKPLRAPPPSQIKTPISSPATSVTKSASKQLTNDDSLFEFLNTPSSRRESCGSDGNTTNSPNSSAVRTKNQTSAISSEVKMSSLAYKREFPRPHSSPVLTQPPMIMEVRKKEEEESKTFDVKESIVFSGEKEEEERKEQIVEVVREDEGGVEENDGDPTEGETSLIMKDHPISSEDMKSTEEVVVVEQFSCSADLEEWKNKASNLQLENKLIKREVVSLNEELASIMSRLNEATKSTDHYQSEIHALREQVSRSDHMIRQLRSHEEDLQAAVEARDSQVEVLRTQLSTTDRAMEATEEELALSKKEQERLLQDANLSSGAQNQALDSLKVKLSQIDAHLVREREERESERVRFTQRESVLQSERNQVLMSLAESRDQVGIEQNRTREVKAELHSSQRELQLLRKEHDEYKQRAGGILQAKEKLIKSLQQHSEGGGVGMEGEARLEEVRLEKEHLQAQLTSNLRQLETTKNDIQDLEEKRANEMETAMDQVRLCEGLLTDERKLHADTKEELVRLTQEIELVREDLIKERTAHRDSINSRESELTDMKLQMNMATPGKSELESCIRELTESLIQKQTTLETLNSEKSTLHVQLQRLQGELLDVRKSKASNPHTVVTVNGLDNTDASQVRFMSSVIPSLDRLATSNSRLHNVRRAVNTVDRVSIRLGAFLKRYPQARLLALFYMRGVNIGLFSKEFNERTKDIKAGIPIPVIIHINSDRTFSFVTTSPPTSYFLKAAAGIEKGAAKPGHEVAGTVSIKHIYEIGLVKAKDPAFEGVPLQSVCKTIAGSARSLGIKITKD